MNKKWIIGIIAAVAVAALAVTAGCYSCHRNWEDRDGRTYHQSISVYRDLMTLSQRPDNGLTQEQAKALLPLVQKLSAANDQTAARELTRKIYAELTVAQYQALSRMDARQNMGMGPNAGPGMMNSKQFRSQRFERNTLNSDRDLALPDMVIKMLKEQSTARPAPQSQPAAIPPASPSIP